jgi:hypothetical protein
MKPVNIYSLLQAKGSLNEENFDSYLKHHGISIKNAELEDLGVLINAARVLGSSVRDFDKFHVGYKIPQIGKEFDLLRFGKNSIVNIELKNNCQIENIKAQLVRNSYYLGFIGRKVLAFTFVSTSGELYFLKEDGQLEKKNLTHLLEVVAKQATDEKETPDSLFNPSDYLVSPLNSTAKFLAGQYFLTHQQEESKSKILDKITSANAAKFISITGSAGTGKTLLTFDVARHLMAGGKKALIIHCGQLNAGHHKLTKNGWSIFSIKNYKPIDFSLFDVAIIDEAQRIFQEQLDDIVARVELAKSACIFSYDKVQTLSSSEARRDIAGKIDLIASITRHKLSEKIRTNKEIATFIKMLFNNKKFAQAQSGGNIQISYFSSNEDAKAYLEGLDDAEWEVLRFTPSQYNNEHHETYFDVSSKTSHEVIGQEFEGVAIAMDKFFVYDDKGDLSYRGGAYYAPTQMLFQNITRARKRLNLVIIDNQEILKRCLAILN